MVPCGLQFGVRYKLELYVLQRGRLTDLQLQTYKVVYSAAFCSQKYLKEGIQQKLKQKTPVLYSTI